MSGQGGKRDRLEDRALAALLSGPTIAQAATKAVVRESTLLRWLAEPSFKVRYRDARCQVVELAVTGRQQATGQAVETLVEEAGGSGTHPDGFEEGKRGWHPTRDGPAGRPTGPSGSRGPWAGGRGADPTRCLPPLIGVVPLLEVTIRRVAPSDAVRPLLVMGSGWHSADGDVRPHRTTLGE